MIKKGTTCVKGDATMQITFDDIKSIFKLGAIAEFETMIDNSEIWFLIKLYVQLNDEQKDDLYMDYPMLINTLHSYMESR